ncbi:MAG: MarR family transcriptional regulator [Gemmatimonas sp.]
MRTAAGDAISRLAFQILRLSADITAAGDELARPAGQTSARWQVLAAADHESSTVADIARALGLTRQSVQRVADLLANDKLVRYDDNPEHQRAKLVRLTAAGCSALQTIQHAQIEWANALAKKLNVADVQRATETLDEITVLLRPPRFLTREINAPDI